MDPPAIAAAFRAACHAELRALKPGNVHLHAPGHGMTVEDFERSAAAAAPFIAAPGASVGARIRRAVEATRACVGCNTNLGIVLLAAPLAAAAEAEAELAQALAHTLAGLGVADAEEAFAAIRAANPAGLGTVATNDVREEARVTLLEAMRQAAGRDRIARQYATDYEDVLGLGLTALRTAIAAEGVGPQGAATVYLTFLAAFPDSHIVRKHGHAEAGTVMARARVLVEGGRGAPASEAELLAFDRELKQAGLNPGTSADLTVATLFAALLGAGSLAR